MKDRGNQQLVCRELAFSADPLFRISHVFADREVSDSLVALCAFFAAIDETCSAISEEEVAARKIAWWKAEADALLNGVGVHPISKELQRTGAAGLMSAGWVTKLMDSARLRMEAPPPADVDGLAVYALAVGMPRLQLELAVCGVKPVGEEALAGIAARRGIYALIRGSLLASDERKNWWIPSNLLARHGLTRAAFALQEHRDSAGEISREILNIDGILSPLSDGLIADISDKKQYLKQFISYDYLLVDKFKNMKKTSYISERGCWEKVRLRDLITCWRAARRVNPWR